MQMQRQRIILIVGVVLALAVVFLVQIYLSQQRQIAMEEARREAAKLQENQSVVLAAKTDIARGTMVKPELIESKIVSGQAVMPQAVVSADRIMGMVALIDIPKGQQITLNTLAFPRKATGAGAGLAELTPPGKRAITINVDNMSSLLGMIKPGDHVDIIAALPIPVQVSEGKQVTQAASVPLFQNVLILAVGQEIGAAPPGGEAQEGRYDKEEARSAQRKEIPSLITIALGPQDASLMSFVQEQGKIRLVLRSPVDSQLQPLGPISWDALFQFLMPKDLASKQKPTEEQAKPPEPTGYVEIYRGLKREKVPYSR